MEVVRDLHWMRRPEDGAAVTVGEFDGIHRGHRVVLSELAHRAALLGCPTVVVTFDRNPFLLIDPSAAPGHLVDLDQKLELLAAAGVDTTVVLPAEFVTPDAAIGDDATLGRLIDDVLVGALGARVIVVGEDFQFGERRRATIDLLDERSARGGFDLVRVPVSSCTLKGGELISAMSIRRALAAGDVELAAKMLGRPYEIRSEVAGGDRRGRSIGFPTANLPLPATAQLPADGVYAGWFTRHDGARYPAAINIGRRPTFYESNDTSLIEAHLVGFRGDLYGEHARLTFVHHLRSERKFNGIDALREQLAADVRATLAALDP